LGSNDPIIDSSRKANQESLATGALAPASRLSKFARVSDRQLLIFMVLNAIGINLVLVFAGALLVHNFKQPSAIRGVVASLIFH
jgi:hypothetical protein